LRALKKIPNSKIQIPMKFQNPDSKFQNTSGYWPLDFGILLEFDHWNLEF